MVISKAIPLDQDAAEKKRFTDFSYDDKSRFTTMFYDIFNNEQMHQICHREIE